MNHSPVTQAKRNTSARLRSADAPTAATTVARCPARETQIDGYRRALETERWHLTLRLKTAEIITVPAFADSMDGSTLEHERHVTLEARDREAMLLAEVNEALVRIDSGAYGLCLRCENPIPPGRLKALPWARLCLACQQEEEMEGQSGGSEVSLATEAELTRPQTRQP